MAGKKRSSTKTIVGYVRVSTEDQANGPEAQRAALEAFARSNGLELVAVHEDRGVSGASPVDKRPGLLAALEDVRSKKAFALLVARRDRLARDVVVAAVAEKLLAQSGARVLACVGANEDTPEAALMRTMLDAFSQYERALIAARTRAALESKKARGEKLGGEVPFGYRVGSDGKTLVEDEAEQAVLVFARELRAEGVTYRELVERLNANGKTCRGAKWHLSTVHRLVAREAS